MRSKDNYGCVTTGHLRLNILWGMVIAKKKTRHLFYLQGSRLVERSGLRSICHWNDKLANVRIWSAVELKLAGEVEERVGDDWKEKSFFISCHNVKSL
jgi:hypothetical protein